MKQKILNILTPHRLLTGFYFLLFITVGLSMVLKQPFGNPPDEYNRFLIPSYIAEHGKLPTGYEEEIRIGGYGFSYAFQPILPYMLQGYTMGLVSLFTESESALLYTARLVNLFLGLLTAFFTLRLGRLWFRNRNFSWLFSFLVTFLPQSLFVHTYVNTDSCCLLSISIILYALTKAYQDSFCISSCILLSIGIILCALSYYNAYGYILSSILLFSAFFLTFREGKASFAWKPFLRKGFFISALVLLGIGWWFIRSYLLFDGDILGLKTREAYASMYALPEFHPDTRETYFNQGYSVWEMLSQSDFLTLTQLSFIGVFGPMTIVTSIWIYRFYRLLFASGILCSVFLRDKANVSARKGYRLFFHFNMILCMLIPPVLSIYYSYSTDYQPQGRYILPILLPFFYYVVRGIEKLCTKISAFPFWKKLIPIGCSLLGALVILSLLITVYGYAFPYYTQNPIAP